MWCILLQITFKLTIGFGFDIDCLQRIPFGNNLVHVKWETTHTQKKKKKNQILEGV